MMLVHSHSIVVVAMRTIVALLVQRGGLANERCVLTDERMVREALPYKMYRGVRIQHRMDPSSSVPIQAGKCGCT
jgi:hypothetical protein